IVCGFNFRKNADTETWTVLYQVYYILKNTFVHKDLDSTKMIYGAIKGMVETTEDPYTRFIEPKSYKEMQTRLEGQFSGIGIHIGMKDKQLTVISPIKGTPAFKAGLEVLDKIMTINGESTKDMSLEEAVSKIRGKKGSKVILGIARKGATKIIDIPITRDVIVVNAIEESKIINAKHKIGYIKLATFENKGAVDEFVEAFTKLEKEGMKNCIIDLRNNGGGLLSNAIDLTSIFIKNKVVVYTIDRNNNKQALYTEKGDYTKFRIPLVILINQASASASEIFAGAIMDHKRGATIGEKSFGKASVQNIRELADNSALLVTVAKYLTPSGHDISEKGIEPNIVVKVPTETLKTLFDPTVKHTIEDDPQLVKAISYLKQKPGIFGRRR
ncbi:S41 family peptidase, partial [Candidatus Margulisiibacteriota bacterium]